jgi:hypothetical protein
MLLLLYSGSAEASDCEFAHTAYRFRGLSTFYNCSVDIQLKLARFDDGISRYTGSIYVFDEHNHRTVALPIYTQDCDHEPKASMVEMLRDRQGFAWRLVEHATIWTGSDKKLLRVRVRSDAVTSGTRQLDVVDCRGVNPVERYRDRDR